MITESAIHSWNKYIDAQQAKHPERSLRWEMERMSTERVRELERVSEARNIVAAASERKDADNRASGERREGAVFAGE